MKKQKECFVCQKEDSKAWIQVKPFGEEDSYVVCSAECLEKFAVRLQKVQRIVRNINKMVTGVVIAMRKLGKDLSESSK